MERCLLQIKQDVYGNKFFTNVQGKRLMHRLTDGTMFSLVHCSMDTKLVDLLLILANQLLSRDGHLFSCDWLVAVTVHDVLEK